MSAKSTSRIVAGKERVNGARASQQFGALESSSVGRVRCRLPAKLRVEMSVPEQLPRAV